MALESLHLAILWNSAFRCLYLSFSPLLFTSLLFKAICKASPDSHFAFLCGWQTLKTRILFELGFDPGASQPLVQDLGIRQEKGEEEVTELLLPWRRLAPRLRGGEQEAPFTFCSVGPRKNDGQP